jgi:type I restriction enzyme R subunit
LKDTNYQTLKHAPEFVKNKETDTPTNKILTSLFTKSRLEMILRYAIVYVDRLDDDT